MNKSQRLQDLRKKSGLTLKDVAEKLGVSEGTIQRYEKGIIKDIPYDSVTGLASLYDVDPAYILGWQAEYRINDIKVLENADLKDIELLKAYHSSSEETQSIIRRILGI